MGDVGDYWREHREYKRKARSFWHECPNCDFGGNPPKVAPGYTCRHCGWKAPGEPGDDIIKAGESEAPVENKTCSECGQVFVRTNDRLQHERDKHGIKIARISFGAKP